MRITPAEIEHHGHDNREPKSYPTAVSRCKKAEDDRSQPKQILAKQLAMTIGSATCAAIFLFFALRELLDHDWRHHLAARLVVGLSMLAATIGAVIFLFSEQWLEAFICFTLAWVLGQVGIRVVLKQIADSEPEVESPSIGETALKAAATFGVFLFAVLHSLG